MWTKTTLGESCKMYQPKTISAKEMVSDGEYVVFGANGIIGRYDKYNHTEPQLLVTCRGATCGSVNVSEPNSWITGNAMVIQPDTSKISMRFMEYVCRGGIDLSKAITGAAQPQITRKSLEPIEFSYPPLAEQQRIVAKLDAAFAEIDKTISSVAAKTKQTEALKASVLAALLTGNTVKLGDVCELTYGKSLDKSERLDDGGYPAFGANGIKTLSKNSLYDKPSIIIGRKGSAGEINKVTEPFWALDVTYYTKINENIINLDYLFYVLTTLNLPSLAKGVKPGINRNDVYEQTIPLPSLSEQQRIVAEIDAAFAKIEIIGSATLAIKDNYISLKSAILAQELNPSEAA